MTEVKTIDIQGVLVDVDTGHDRGLLVNRTGETTDTAEEFQDA
jgi:hypothetical protein